MITLYYNNRNKTSRQAIEWLTNRGIRFRKKKIEHITNDDLVQILFLSERGFCDIIKNFNICGTSHQEKIEKLYQMKFSESVDYIIKNPELLRTPILLGKNKLMIGYNSEEIRIFLQRKLITMRKLEK